MSDTTKPNISISISGGQFRDFVTGDKTIHGDEIETQINYGAVSDTEQLATELDEFLQSIAQQISNPNNEAAKVNGDQISDSNREDAKKRVADAAIKEIEYNKPSLRDRLVAALTAGAFEAIKKIAKNDFVEVFLTAFKAGLEAKPKK